MRGIPALVMAQGVLIVMVVAGIAVGEVRLRAESKEGELVFSPEVVDLGRVPLDVPAPARFEMRNVGGKTVRILGKPKIAALEGC